MDETQKPYVGSIEANGTQIYYEMMGKGHSMVFLHGGYMDRRMWDDQFAVFAKHFQVVRYDIRGFGKTPLPPITYADRHDLYMVLRHLGIEKAILLGLSLGGSIAIDFTLEHPEMVEALILVGAVVHGYPPEIMFTQSQLEELMQRGSLFEKARQEKNIPALVDFLMNDPTFVPSKAYPAARQRAHEILSGYSFDWVINPAPKQELMPSAYERLTEIQVPTLIVVGSDDNFQLHKSADKLEKDIRDVKKVEIPETHHMPNMEKPDEFNCTILDFLVKALPKSE